jgi:hypothetical protein
VPARHYHCEAASGLGSLARFSLGRTCQLRHRPLRSAREEGHEAPGQRQDVLNPLPERRQLHLHHIQPIEQILAKPPRCHLLLQIPVTSEAKSVEVDVHELGGAPSPARDVDARRAEVRFEQRRQPDPAGRHLRPVIVEQLMPDRGVGLG